MLEIIYDIQKLLSFIMIQEVEFSDEEVEFITVAPKVNKNEPIIRQNQQSEKGIEVNNAKNDFYPISAPIEPETKL